MEFEEFETESEEWAAYLLGKSTPTQPIRYCWTVNLSPDYSVRHSRGEPWIRWSSLTPRQQHLWFHTVFLPDVVRPNCDAYKFTYELCKSGELHCHGSLLVFDKPALEDYYLACMRKSVKPVVYPARSKTAKPLTDKAIRTMNCITKNEAYRHDEWATYLDKDKDKVPFEPSYYFNRLARRKQDH